MPNDNDDQLTLEKLQISTRLTSVETQLVFLKPMIEQIHGSIVGKGTEAEPGMRVEVDRLKQSHKNANFHYAAFYIAGVGIVCKSVWEFITKAR